MKLFTIGDSISQGFMSGAAARTDLAYSTLDRKSTRLNSSHANISYAVFCLKKKKKKQQTINHIIIVIKHAPLTIIHDYLVIRYIQYTLSLRVPADAHSTLPTAVVAALPA